MGRQIDDIRWQWDQVTIESGVSDLREKYALITLQHRNMEHNLSLEPFATAWRRSNNEDRAKFLKLINDGDVEGLKRLIRYVAFNDISLSDLRDMASKLHIKNYSRMTKSELLGRIEHEKATQEAGKSNSVAPNAGAVDSTDNISPQ